MHRLNTLWKLPLVLAIASLAMACQSLAPIDWDARLQAGWKGYDFGSGPVAPHFTPVDSAAPYSEAAGFGFQPGAAIQIAPDAATANRPFAFSVALPEGAYLVEVELGHPTADSVTTVKDEMRRLKLEKIAVPAGQSVTRGFTAHVRRPEFGDGDRVRLKDRERNNEMVLWDENLRIEFTGLNPAVRSLTIMPADDLPALYLLGDSTITDQPRPPWNSWGQMITNFFEPTLVVANFANSGESVRSSLGSRRFAKVYSLLKPGDYVMIQFGHNDMKSNDPNKVAIYKQDLKDFIAETRKRGATPVLVTSMERKSGIRADTLQEYPQTVRDVAAEEGVALVDLHARSKVFYRALGDDLDMAFNDGTHHNNYGSYQLASIIVDSLSKLNSGLEKHIVEDFKGYDPANPPSPHTFTLPDSNDRPGETPLGD